MSALRCAAVTSVALAGLLGAGGPASGADARRADPHPEWLRVTTGGSPPPLPAVALTEERERALREAGAGYSDLLWRAELHVAEDGTLTERVTHLRLFFDEIGIGQGGDVVLLARPSHETLAIEHAGVRLADGSYFGVEPHTVQVTAGEQPGVFSDRRAVTVPLPALTEGATGVAVYTRHYRGGDWPLPWSWHLPLQAAAAVERYEVEVAWEPGVPDPAWRTSDPALECVEGERSLRCSRLRTEPLDADPDVSASGDMVPEFLLAERRTWQEIALDVGALVEEARREPLPRDTLARLLGDARTDTEKWEVLYRFVADDVRYLGLEHGVNAVVPRAPATTLSRRFGDCKDKVTLFAALARAAGLPVVPVLVATDRFQPESLLLPSVNYFDHMIACWEAGDGADAGGAGSGPGLETCADLTVRGASPADSVLGLRDRVALPLRERTRAVTILSGDRFGWRVEIEGETRLDCDGSTEKREERRLRGGALRMFRETYGGLTVAQRRRFLIDEYRRATTSPVVPETRVSGVRDAPGPVTISTTFTTPPAQSLFDGYQYADDDAWVRAYGLVFRSENQHYATWVPGLVLRSRQRYALCDGFRAGLLGPALALESELGSLERSYRSEESGTVMVVDTTLEIPGGLRAPAEIRRLNHFLDNALDQVAIWFDIRER